MNRLDSLSGDPVLGPFLPEWIHLADQKEAEIFGRNKKGQVLDRIMESMPQVIPTTIDLDRDRIRIGVPDDLDDAQSSDLYEALQRLKPWRKGPFDVFGVPLDSEWDSSLKWNRLADHLDSQTGKRILDIGSSCGYYMFRLAVTKPGLVLGLEPHLNYYYQFLALSRYLDHPAIHSLPLKLEALTPLRRCFDTVLCMGILYHQRSPLDTLLQIHRMMVPGGQLVLETLIVEGDGHMALFPQNRYARMKNVFFIPTVACLTHWLQRSGFDHIRCVDVSRTTVQEQRKTAWIDTQSLEDFLDPDDPTRTVEGYPAPLRAMALATARPR